ncbi:sodium/hydrogen exchanger [Desulfurobacterium thermolithotrophum DSM 11699]|uniref:Sodium/hydrogen exchanger n=1 Tax=Desulfurobacterium thermolithotrophum (strain DSM 11699 / BSA) TaxID=868864 RepID=F0S365_DESTD|nr:cation:proton antiporter [Desulfurobacterium thermolithotrophum]ADY73287.1 sodium/hydrogen exchanger [Desulfurobacterium thermolithotrophum DSM 11699]
MESSLISIILISLGILFVPFLSKILKIPVAVGEILYGIILGKSVLNLVEPSQWLDFLASFGFLLLMFVAGLEVKLKEISTLSLKTKIVLTSIPLFVFFLAFLIGSKFSFPAIVSIAIGVVSVGIVVSVLREKALLNTPFGKALFLTGIVGEVVSIAVLTLFSLYIEFHFGIEFWIGILKLIMYLITARLVLLFLKSFVWWYPNRFKFFFEKSPSEIGIRISLAVMFMLSVAASIIHIEPIIGAFIAGMIFATVFEDTESIEEKLSGISFGFLVPIFFIYVGINFKMPELNIHTLSLLGTLVLASFSVKIIPSLLLIFEGLGLRKAIAGGFLLSAPLTLVIVTAELGKKLGVIDEHFENILILLSIVTGVLAPTLFNLLNREEEIEDINS